MNPPARPAAKKQHQIQGKPVGKPNALAFLPAPPGFLPAPLNLDGHGLNHPHLLRKTIQHGDELFTGENVRPHIVGLAVDYFPIARNQAGGSRPGTSLFAVLATVVVLELLTQQLRRLENALARDKLSQAKREEHIRNSMEGAVRSFKSRYTSFDKGSVQLYTAESQREDLDREIFANIHLEGYPAREFNSMMNDLHNVLADYEKLNHRNKKKDDNHLNKHAMHLIRLYLMCLDILEKGDIITYREADHDLLMSIRHGEYQREDGTYRQEFFDMVSEFEKKLAYAKENTSLPAHPDMKKVEEFVMDVNRRSLDG